MKVRPRNDGNCAIDRVAVTFSESMVAVPSSRELFPERLPVRLSPAPRGRWHWSSGRTLVFESEEGLAGPCTLASVLGAEALSGEMLEPFCITLGNACRFRPLAQEWRSPRLELAAG
ncbi:MAG: hypothetical protein HY319_19215 [Armatimonadetes bacterium]|nr:hypothetical protein [Armatimonadota bacterium]